MLIFDLIAVDMWLFEILFSARLKRKSLKYGYFLMSSLLWLGYPAFSLGMVYKDMCKWFVTTVPPVIRIITCI
jgi:hypothetical protein